MLRWPERDRADWLALRWHQADAGGGGPRRGRRLGPRRLGRGGGPDLAITGWTRSISWRPASGREGSSRSLSFSAGHAPIVPTALSAHAAAGGPSRTHFSTLALLCVIVVLASGVYAVVQQVGGVPSPPLHDVRGHWLLLKLALLVPLLAVALLDRTYVRPRIRARGRRGRRRGRGRRARRGPQALAAFEVLLVAAILGAVAVLGLDDPAARHDPIAWPLPFRLV